MPDVARSSSAAQRNRDIDAIDLTAGLGALPAAADPTLSPLSNIGRPEPTPTEPSIEQPEPAPGGTTPSARSTGRRRTERPSSLTSLSGGRGRRDPDVEQQRSERDDRRARLVREALAARGLDPDALVEQRLPKGGKHRPTIELSPDDYAAITIATTLHPDLFGTTLVGFIRACARHWEPIAAALEAERRQASD